MEKTCRTSLVIVNSDIRENGCGPQNMSMDPQLRSMLQWVAASLADIPHIQLTRDKDLKQVITNRPNPPLFICNRFFTSAVVVKAKDFPECVILSQ